MVAIIGNEFPVKSMVEDLKRKGRLKANSLVPIAIDHNQSNVFLSNVSFGGCFLGSLILPLPLKFLFIDFFDKFAKKRNYNCLWQPYWKIEYELLVKIYEAFKHNFQELKQIWKVAKTKKELKIHLGVS